MLPEPTVVVVDDEDAVRESLQAMLEAEGFAVETFAAAADFLEGYRPISNSCLLLDVRMPGMNGIELLTKLATRVSSPPVDHDDRARRCAHGGHGNEARRRRLHREAVRARDTRAQHSRRADHLPPRLDHEPSY
jgi:chemotaxis response regulator CheB